MYMILRKNNFYSFVFRPFVSFCFLGFLLGFLLGFFLGCSKPLPVFPLNTEENFQLKTQENHAFELADFKSNKIKLVYFGFTRCPEVCPKTMERLEKLNKILGIRASSIQIFFVTIDPEYDTPIILKKFLSKYSMRVTGLTGAKEEIKKISNMFASFFIDKEERQNFEEHNTQIFLLDYQTRLRSFIKKEESPQKIATLIRSL